MQSRTWQLSQPYCPNLQFICLPAPGTLACRQNCSIHFQFTHCLSEERIFQPCPRVALRLLARVHYMFTSESLMLPPAPLLPVIKSSLQRKRRHLVCQVHQNLGAIRVHALRENTLSLFAWRWQFTEFFPFFCCCVFPTKQLRKITTTTDWSAYIDPLAKPYYRKRDETKTLSKPNISMSLRKETKV